MKQVFEDDDRKAITELRQTIEVAVRKMQVQVENALDQVKKSEERCRAAQLELEKWRTAFFCALRPIPRILSLRR